MIDSIELYPVSSPERARVHWRQRTPQTVGLERQDTTLTYSGKDLRLDIGLEVTNGKRYGVLTHDAWAQGLTFSRSNDGWTSEPPKPEIIDTDYLLYLEFFRDAAGELQARIQSNKENRKLHFVINRVDVSGSEVSFDLSSDRFSLVAEYDPGEDRLFLDYANAGGARRIELERQIPSNQEGYLPRPTDAVYKYQVPASEPGSWETASLVEAGVAPSITGLVEAMGSGEYEHVHSVVVVKDGRLVFEEYFHGYDRDYLHDVRSAFKSIAALLLGEVSGRDKGVSVHSRLLDFYPEYAKGNSKKDAITLEHALTMTTGIEREDEDEMQWRNDDWVAYKLGLPVEHTPGEQFEYSSGGAHLLSGVIQKASGRYLPVFLHQQLLLPLGIERFQMLVSPAGRGYLAGNFHLRAIDLAKFGQLMLDRGRWRDEQVIDELWVTEIVQPRVETTWPKGGRYGYLWRLLEREVEGRAYRTIEAWGNGGQFLIVIPELEAVVVFTGGNFNLFPEMEDKPFALLDRYILPALVQ